VLIFIELGPPNLRQSAMFYAAIRKPACIRQARRAGARKIKVQPILEPLDVPTDGRLLRAEHRRYAPEAPASATATK